MSDVHVRFIVQERSEFLDGVPFERDGEALAVTKTRTWTSFLSDCPPGVTRFGFDRPIWAHELIVRVPDFKGELEAAKQAGRAELFEELKNLSLAELVERLSEDEED